jgi:hypothetical protein
MIDKKSRKKLSESLRHLVSGQMTNYKFEGATPRKSPDRAIWPIRRQAWFLYDDLHEHKLVKNYKLPKESKKEIARWILFLQTGLEYEWPQHPTETLWGALLSLMSLSLIPRIFWNRPYKRAGNYEVWPFIRQSDFIKAKRNPRLLKGI